MCRGCSLQFPQILHTVIKAPLTSFEEKFGVGVFEQSLFTASKAHQRTVTKSAFLADWTMLNTGKKVWSLTYMIFHDSNTNACVTDLLLLFWHLSKHGSSPHTCLGDVPHTEAEQGGEDCLSWERWGGAAVFVGCKSKITTLWHCGFIMQYNQNIDCITNISISDGQVIEHSCCLLMSWTDNKNNNNNNNKVWQEL